MGKEKFFMMRLIEQMTVNKEELANLKRVKLSGGPKMGYHVFCPLLRMKAQNVTVEMFADYSYLTSTDHVIGKMVSFECEELISEVTTTNQIKV